MPQTNAGNGQQAWVEWSLLDAADLIRGVSYKREEARREAGAGLIPVLRATNIEDSVLGFDDLVWVPKRRVGPDQRIRKGDIVIAMSSGSRAVVGKAAIALTDWPGGFGTFCGVLRARPEFEPRYIERFLQSADYREQIDSVVTGTNINNLSKATLGQIRIPKAPKDLQVEIADLLDGANIRLRGAMGHTRDARKSISQFRQAVLAAACSGRLTSGWRIGRTDASATNLVRDLDAKHRVATVRQRTGGAVEDSMRELDPFDLPPSWTAASLATLCKPGRPITYGILKPGPDVNGGVPYVRVTDFKSGVIRLEGLRRTSVKIAGDYRRSSLRSGDLLFAIRGTVGHVATVPAELDGANITQDSARLSIDESISAGFVSIALRGPDAQSRVSRAMKGVAVRGINLGDLRELLLPVPPRAEQDEIVRLVDQLLSVVVALDARIEAAARAIDVTSQAVLAKAFRGELSGGARQSRLGESRLNQE